MKAVLAHIDHKIALLGKHPLFSWLSSGQLPPAERLLILPGVVTMAMGFRDVNKWVLRYPHASGELERGINIHTFEDQTHSRLFLEDWRLLDLDKRLGWTASDTLWWLFLADANEAARRYGVYFLSLPAVDGDDPLLRFAQAEVGERCARDLFFRHASAVASDLARGTGTELRYLGPHHLDAEGEGAEHLFEALVLDDTHRARALRVVDAMAEVFADAFDSMLGYARAYVDSGQPPRPAPSGPAGVPMPTRAICPAACEPDESLDWLIRERSVRLERHPLFTWFGHRNPSISASQALRRFFPLWAMYFLGRRDIVRYAIACPGPATELELAVNAAAEDLIAHTGSCLDDWRQLGLDRALDWTASQTLEFCYIDRLLDRHRKDRVRLTALAGTHHDPLARLWLLRGLHASTEVILRHCAELAAEAESADGLRLDFLGGRHLPAVSPPVVSPSVVSPPVAAPVRGPVPDAARRQEAADLLTAVFDQAEDHLDLSLDVALANDFAIG
jgi:hypothetical protein